MSKFKEMLKHPRGWFLADVYGITAAAITLSILSVTVLNFGVFAYIFYGLAALSLGYTVYTFVIYAPKCRRGIVNFLNRFGFTARMLENYGFRTIVFAVVGFTVSVANAALNGVIAAVGRSIWYGALAVYYALLVVMRGSILLYHKNKARSKVIEIKKYRASGVMLVLLPICLSFAILQMVRDDSGFVYAGLMIYASAAYTFYKIIHAACNSVKARKNCDITVSAIRNINLADAMVSVLALQTAMFKEFGGGIDTRLMNAITGGAVCLLTAALGVFMIIKANKIIKRETE